MLTETGRVVSTSGGRAKVAIVRSEACGHCPAKSMCNATDTGNTNVLEVRNPAEAKPGEKVVIELQPEALLKATAMVYLLPATVMVSGATAGWLSTGNDLGAMVGALAGLAASTFFLFIHGRRKNVVRGPVISSVLPRGNVPATGSNHGHC